MSTKQLIKHINYPYCPKGAFHNGQFLSNICLDTKCRQKALICGICQQLNHNGHDTITLKHYLQIITNGAGILSTQSNQLSQITQIQYYRNSCLSFMRNIKKQLNEKLIQLQRKIIKYFDYVEDIGTNLLDSQSPLTKLIDKLVFSSEINAEEIMSKFQKILNIFQLDECKKFKLKEKIDHITNQAGTNECALTTSLTQLDIYITNAFNNLSKYFQAKIDFSSKPVYFLWSNNLKGSKIKVTQRIAQQTGMEYAGQRFILMQPSLGKNMKKKNWGIRIKKFGGWIGIGISLQKLIKNSNYHFNYTVLGHGSYLISHNGYSWSHSVKQANLNYKCFTFTVNDIVYMQFDPIANKLRFRKNNSFDPKDKFQLDIEPAPINDDYSPSANLCMMHDIVQIIYPGKPLS